MSEWLKYRKKGITEMRPYVEGETLEGVSVSQRDRDDGHPAKGDMVARDPLSTGDQWLMTQSFFAANYEPALQAVVEEPPVGLRAKKDERIHTAAEEARIANAARKKDDDDDDPKKKDELHRKTTLPVEKDEPKKR